MATKFEKKNVALTEYMNLKTTNPFFFLKLVKNIRTINGRGALKLLFYDLIVRNNKTFSVVDVFY